MFPVTITVHTLQDLDRVRAALYDSANGRGRGTVEPVKATATAKPADKSVETSTAKVYTVDEAKALTKGAVSNNKKAEVVALLDKFVTQLPEGYKGIKTAAHLQGEAVQQFCIEAAKLQKGVA